MIQRPHQILKEFANQGYKSILYNVNSTNREIIEVKQNLYIYNKIRPPAGNGGKKIIWISYPPLYKQIAPWVDKDLVVFDCIDYPEDQFKHWSRGIDQLRQKSDFIFVTSQSLYEFNNEYKDKTYICKNGADFNHFARAKTVYCDKPDDMKNIKGPIVGYFGAIAEWIDWKLLTFLAEKNKFSIVLLGPLFKLSRLPINHEKIFYLGEKNYEDLPRYLQNFDACIIPFLENRLTSACNPIKMYEYLSAGKPVITTNLQECKVETVKSAKDYHEFYLNLMDCLNENYSEDIEKRILFAQDNSWESRVRYIRSVIEPELRKIKEN